MITSQTITTHQASKITQLWLLLSMAVLNYCALSNRPWWSQSPPRLYRQNLKGVRSNMEQSLYRIVIIIATAMLSLWYRKHLMRCKRTIRSLRLIIRFSTAANMATSFPTFVTTWMYFRKPISKALEGRQIDKKWMKKIRTAPKKNSWRPFKTASERTSSIRTKCPHHHWRTRDGKRASFSEDNTYN